MTALEVSASGLDAQRIRMNIAAMNLANIHTTRTRSGGPYRRKSVIFEAIPVQNPFDRILQASLLMPGYSRQGSLFSEPPTGVRVVNIVNDNRAFKRVFEPSHPDADKDGYVMLPNINVIEEMVNMLMASRSYEANITTFQATKNMILKAIEIIK